MRVKVIEFVIFYIDYTSECFKLTKINVVFQYFKRVSDFSFTKYLILLLFFVFVVIVISLFNTFIKPVKH